MEVENIDIVGLQLLERLFDRYLHALGMIAGTARSLSIGLHYSDTAHILVGLVGSVASVAGCILGSNDHLVSVASFLHPFSEPLLTFSFLIVVCLN